MGLGTFSWGWLCTRLPTLATSDHRVRLFTFSAQHCVTDTKPMTLDLTRINEVDAARKWHTQFRESSLPQGTITFSRSIGPGGQHANEYVNCVWIQY